MRAVIVASGKLAGNDARWLDGADLVIAADGGAASTDALGRRPDLVVGDLDSAEPGLIERLEAAGTRIERHPADKDASDTELALGAARAAGATEVVVLGALGGPRLDHELANVLLIADPDLRDWDVVIAHGATRVRALHGGAALTLAGEVGDRATLLPLAGDATGVTTDGLRWQLVDATLRMGRSRGLSNEVTVSPASVRLGRGTLIVVETELQRSIR
jgi:thiamine pyrophosphokinase